VGLIVAAALLDDTRLNATAATVIVWIAALLAAFVQPFLGLKKYLEERRV
jgi:ABC-type transport system involved in cytochrome c biogenesis permease component